MLQQILNDMYIEPELLAELDEEQKQLLFCKMREEQVRRWRIRESKLESEEFSKPSKEGSKKVSFKVDNAGEPIVFVIGALDDEVEALPEKQQTILEQKAKDQAELESEALRKATEEELNKLVKLGREQCNEVTNVTTESTKLNPENNDPTREAVVKSLQEATIEMEKKLKEQESNIVSVNKSEKKPSPVTDKKPLFNLSSYGENKKNVINLADRPSKLQPLIKKENKPPFQEDSKSVFTLRSLRGMNSNDFPYKNDSKNEVKVSAQIEQYEKLSKSSLEALKTATLERAKERRQKEILEHLKKQVHAAKTETTQSEELAWKDQERKAKEAEKRFREIARRAREEHKRSSISSPEKIINDICSYESPSDLIQSKDLNPKSESIPIKKNTDIQKNFKDSTSKRSYKPPTKDSLIGWFKNHELTKGACIETDSKKISPWFHGIIGRNEAERLLEKEEVGSFLVRLSERMWGYVVSYKSPERCRHYLIDITEEKYAFLGSSKIIHNSLGDLVNYHRTHPISTNSNELLMKPCRILDSNKPEFKSLFLDTEFNKSN